MEDKSKLTAIGRRDISAPVKGLKPILTQWLKYRSVLHHGCGRSVKDSEFLRSVSAVYAEYDPNFAPDRTVLLKRYDIVVSNFVLNVLPPEDRNDAWTDIATCVKKHGIGHAYITVRSDKDTSIKGEPYQDGVVTSKGTFQKGYSVEDFQVEAESFFSDVFISRHGHYLTAMCKYPSF